MKKEEHYDKLKNLNDLNTDDLDILIKQSIDIKIEIVSQDLNENGIRKALNFGHTLGHAIESYFLEENSQITLLHGEAIAIGMILEAYLSTKLTGLRQEESDEIKTVFNSIYPKIDFTPNEIEAILSLLQYDKKNSHGKVKFVLLEAIGKPVTDIEVPVALFQASFDYYKQ